MSQQPREVVLGTESPPPPVLKIQSPVRTSRPTTMTPLRQSPVQLGKASSSSNNTSNSSSPSHHSNSHQLQGHHSPDITFGLGSQLLPSKRRWSNSDSEELMDLEDETVGDESNSVVNTTCVRKLDDTGNDATETAAQNEKNEFSWTPVEMSALYRTMLAYGYRPGGFNKHINMIPVLQRFCSITSVKVDSKVIWNHLGLLYHLEKLDKALAEDLPIEDFSLSPELQELANQFTKEKENDIVNEQIK